MMQRLLDWHRPYLHSTSMFYWTLSLLFILRYTLQGVGQSVVPTIAGIMELVMRAVGCAALEVRSDFPVSALRMHWHGRALCARLRFLTFLPCGV